MKTRPIFFNLMGLTFFCLALSMPLQIAQIYGHGLSEFPMIMSKMTFINWFTFSLLFSCSVLSLMVNQLLLFVLPLTAISTIGNNLLVALYGEDYTLKETTFASLFVLFATGLYYQKDIYRCLRDSKTRWWKTKKRVQKSYPIDITTNESYIRGLSYDISQTGLFIQDDEILSMSGLQIGDELVLYIKLPIGLVECDGKIVRKTKSEKGGYPPGIGIEFTKIPSQLNHFVNEVLYRPAEAMAH